MKRITQRGVAALELAILIIPLLLIAFGASELGRAFYYYNTMLKATRDAARYLSVMPSGEGINNARCLAVFGKMPCADLDPGSSLLPGLTREMVNIPADTTVELKGPDGAVIGSLSIATVTITGYPFVPLAPFLLSDTRSLKWEAFTFGDVSTRMARLL
jgi:hypothetical protein